MFGDISWDDDGTGEGSGFLSMSCAFLKAAPHSWRMRPGLPVRVHVVLIYMSRTNPWLLRGQHSIDARGQCSLRTGSQTRLSADRPDGAETDL